MMDEDLFFLYLYSLHLPLPLLPQTHLEYMLQMQEEKTGALKEKINYSNVFYLKICDG